MSKVKLRLILCVEDFYMIDSMEKKNTIVIFTAKLARSLLKDGFTIVDIKPDRTDKDSKRSVFVFRNENHIEDKIKEYNNK